MKFDSEGYLYTPDSIVFKGVRLPIPNPGWAYVYVKKSKIMKEIKLDSERPIFLGCTTNQIYFNCNNCTYVGVSNVQRYKGCSHLIFGMCTLGIGFMTDVGMDRHHYCPSCNKFIGYSQML
jgi:hypothetical protein